MGKGLEVSANEKQEIVANNKRRGILVILDFMICEVHCLDSEANKLIKTNIFFQ